MFSTCFTWWINKFWLSLGSLTVSIVFVYFFVIFDVVDGDRVVGFCCQDLFVCLHPVFSVFSAGDTDFCKIQAFYSGGTLVCVFRHSFLRHLGSQCIFLARHGLSNHLVLIPFQSVRQSVHVCHFPSGSDSLTSSSLVAFRHK